MRSGFQFGSFNHGPAADLNIACVGQLRAPSFALAMMAPTVTEQTKGVSQANNGRPNTSS
jgi:hypothetical protein